MADRLSDRRSSSGAPSAGGRSPPRLPVPESLGDEIRLEVLDGFAPQSPAPSHAPSGGPLAVEPLSRGTSLNLALHTSTTAEISDQQCADPPLPLRGDGPSNQALPRRTPSTVTVSTVSNATNSSIVLRAASPFRGPSRPTHPYAMYPQGTGPSPVLSVVSAISVPDEPFVTARGPTHPYGMYPQNTVPEGADAGDSAPVMSIPVGFPGLGQNYQRRLGPEGEEAADIIGPDGHTEQLPPYTRYPDGVPPKGRIVSAGVGNDSGAPDVSPSIPENNPSIPENNPSIPENNPSHSQVSVGIPQSPLSVRSVVSDSSRAQLNAVGTTGSDASESVKEKLAKRRKKRICGVRISVCWIAIAILLLAFLVGGVAGGLFTRHRERKRLSLMNPESKSTPTVFSTVTTILDASPIPTRPPYIPPLPTGTWTVSVNAIDSLDLCLRNQSDRSTWSCAPSSNLRNLKIDITPDQSGGYGSIRLSSTDGPSNPKYGAQAPFFSVSQDVQLAMDINDPGRGPAYFFYLTYDKVVILHESEFTPSKSTDYSLKRDIGDQNNDLVGIGAGDLPVGVPYQASHWDMSRRDNTMAGDIIWVCVWNNTLLEGFIYITQNSNKNSPDSSTTSSATPTSPTQSLSPKLLQYPYIFKIEERRIPASQSQPEPYCQMMRVSSDGLSMVPLWNSTGGLIIETLHEHKPWDKSQQRLANRGSSPSRLKERGTEYPCFCDWRSS